MHPKTGRRLAVAWITLGLFLAAAAPIAAQEPAGQEPEKGQPAPGVGQEEKKPPKGLFPGIEVDLEGRRLTLEGAIAIPKGLIELVACTSWGKTHESICSLEVDPSHLKAALLMLGLEESPQVTKLGEPKALKGDRVIIYLEWEKDGKPVRHRVEKLIWDRTTGATMEEVGWVFTGSRFLKVPDYSPAGEEIGERELFMASETGSLVTTFHDPNAILDNPLLKGGDDTIYYANDKLLPPRGTPVRFIVEATEKKKEADPGKDEERKTPEPPEDGGNKDQGEAPRRSPRSVGEAR